MKNTRRLGYVPGLLAVSACMGLTGPETEDGATTTPAERTAAAVMPVQAASGPHAPEGVNPFAGAHFYVDPQFQERVAQMAAQDPERRAHIEDVADNPTGLWLDSIASLAGMAGHLDAAQAKEQALGEPVVPVFVVYNLPNRDCSASSSAGELSRENDGEARYRSEFIDVIAAELAARAPQRVVVILEPDSLPNVATNLDVPKCAASAELYKSSIAYAISKLSLPNVFVYLDAAHAGWLGWDGNRAKIAQIFREVLDAAGGVDRIRGFATNVSNYNPLSGEDGLRLEPSTPTPNELVYVQKLSASLAAEGIRDKGFIIDTSRNGKGGIRSSWGNWCNIEGAALGEPPRVAPAPLVDAYFWVKPPGDSDGTSDASATRFDPSCRSADSAPNAPEAGKWFPAYFLELVKNAQAAG